MTNNPPSIDADRQTTDTQQSWSTVVKSSNSKQVLPQTDDLVRAVHKDLISQKERKKNIVVSGLNSSATISDKDLFKNLVGSHLNMIPVPQLTFTRRLKTSSSSSSKPLLLVCFSTEDVATQVLSRARNLGSSESEHIRSNVFINRDLTKAEAAAAFEIRKQRRDRVHSKVQLAQTNNVVDQASPKSSGSKSSVIVPSSVPSPSVHIADDAIP